MNAVSAGCGGGWIVEVPVALDVFGMRRAAARCNGHASSEAQAVVEWLIDVIWERDIPITNRPMKRCFWVIVLLPIWTGSGTVYQLYHLGRCTLCRIAEHFEPEKAVQVKVPELPYTHSDHTRHLLLGGREERD